MASVFLGEFFRATVPARLGLVAAGGLIMALTNFLRVFTLSLVTARFGMESAASWHDWIGGTATALAFGSLGLLASRLGRNHPDVRSEGDTPHPSPGSRLGGPACALAFLAIPFVVAPLFSPAPGVAPLAAPSLRVRTSAAPGGWGVQTGELTARQQALLQFSEGGSISVRTPAGMVAQVLHLFWKPGSTMPLFAHQHTPALCMPSAGWIPVGGMERLTLTVHGRPVVCALYRFTQENEPLVALQALFCNGESQSAVGEPRDARRLRRVTELWEGLKQPGLNEELLLYIPSAGGTEQLQRDAAEILETVFEPAAP
jgi:exosortase/archaeosortase family protein